MAMYNGEIVTDGINAGVEAPSSVAWKSPRIAKIESDGYYHYVPSNTNPRQTRYKVRVTPVETSCPPRLRDSPL